MTADNEIHIPAQQDLPYVVRDLIQVIQDMVTRIQLLEMEIYRLGGFRDGSTAH